ATGRSAGANPPVAAGSGAAGSHQSAVPPQSQRSDVTGKTAGAAKFQRRIPSPGPGTRRRPGALGAVRAFLQRVGDRLQAPVAAEDRRPLTLPPTPGLVLVHVAVCSGPDQAAPIPAVSGTVAGALARQQPAVLAGRKTRLSRRAGQRG